MMMKNQEFELTFSLLLLRISETRRGRIGGDNIEDTKKAFFSRERERELNLNLNLNLVYSALVILLPTEGADSNKDKRDPGQSGARRPSAGSN